MSEIKGQVSMFDLPKEKPRPCDYSFQQYIGQEVKRWRTGEILKITSIELYYTDLDDGSVATPYDICEVE